MKILVSDSLSKQGVELLEKAGFTVVVKSKMPKDELFKEIKDADGLIVRSGTKVTAELIEAAPKLKIVGRAGSGLDNVDTPAATKRGIVVMNTPFGNAITTAEHAAETARDQNHDGIVVEATRPSSPETAASQRNAREVRISRRGSRVLPRSGTRGRPPARRRPPPGSAPR